MRMADPTHLMTLPFVISLGQRFATDRNALLRKDLDTKTPLFRDSQKNRETAAL